MKRITLFLAALLILPLGCKTATSTTPPAALAPGFSNTADQTMGDVLKSARVFYLTAQCETQGLNYSLTTKACVPDPAITAPLVRSATEKSAFNSFSESLNAADTVYLAYHSGTATQLAAQTAVNSVQAQQSVLPALAVTK